jgi:hypothetical protein
MFGIRDLKTEMLKDSGHCPVKQCGRIVKKMRNADLRSLRSYLEKEKSPKETVGFKDLFCAEHKIYVTPSTFMYEDLSDNLLWYDGEDREALDRVLKFKRVRAQFHHDNSEDAVSWNVFRFLERNELVDGFLSSVTGNPVTSSEMIYWSYSQKDNETWPELNEARKEFGEEPKRGSEPDIIIGTDRALFFIEAKLTATNNTSPSDSENPKRYEVGGGSWFSKVFKTDFKTIAVHEKKYELMRFWLLGTWMAYQQKKDFCLINLVRDAKERNIESQFGQLIRENHQRRFMRVTWEKIYEFVCGAATPSDKDQMIRFFKNKTIGYDGKGNLQPAFQVS